MKIAFNPSTVAALIAPPNNKDITFDLRGHNIFARGVKFCGTDTNTWRDIKINNVSIDSNILDLRDGSNTTLTNTNGVVTINSTWRPVVDNLTSNSTTSSLSANLGRILKALIDGKSNSGHTHDDRYLKLTGGTMQLGEGLKFHADDNYFGINSDARIISLLDGNDKVCDGGLIIDERATYNGTEYVTELLRIRDSEFKWKGSNILHSGNTYVSNNKGYIYGNEITLVNNADTVDGYHASSLVKFYLSPMASSAPADSAKSWFTNTMPSGSGAIVYNVPGAEKTIIVGKSTGAHGHMLQLNYDDNYLRMLRYRGGSWMSTDWEKISAGYADSAGSVAWSNVTGKPSSYTPSAHTHSWTSITDKLVGGNEFNIVSAGFDNPMWFNYLPIDNRNSTAYIHSYHFGNGQQGHASILASGFVKTGSNSSYVLLGDGGHKLISDFATAGHNHDDRYAYSKVIYYNTNSGGFEQTTPFWFKFCTLPGRGNGGEFYTLIIEATNGSDAPQVTTIDLARSYNNDSSIRGWNLVQKTSLFYYNGLGCVAQITIDSSNNIWFYYDSTWKLNLKLKVTIQSTVSNITILTLDLAKSTITTTAPSAVYGGNIIIKKVSTAIYSNRGIIDVPILYENGVRVSLNGHTHAYLPLSGGTMSGTIYRNSGGSTISGRDHAIIRLTYAPGGSSWNPIACVDTETGTWTLGHLSSGDSDTNFHFCFSTNADYNAGNNNGNYVTLRNKVGTIALLSDIPSSLKNPYALTISLNGTSQGPYDGSAAKNINITPSSIGAATSGHTHDGRYLRWNGFTADISAMGWGTLTSANGYTILSHAASSDGGDMGFVNKNGQIFMLLDGYYYQNEGRYRVLDTSDFTAFSNAGSLTTRITIGGITKDLKIDADTVDTHHAGYLNNNVALLCPWPGMSTMKNAGFLPNEYGTSGYGYPDNIYLLAICKWAIATYSNLGDITLIGEIAPNSSGTCILHLYSSNGKDSSTLLPRYCSGTYTSLSGYTFHFGTVDYSWYYKREALTSDIPTVTDYYWANVKVSASANTQTQPSVNTIYANNWFRSQGDSGWYNESYGGGINMTDSTWVRIYNNKKFYVSNSEYDAIHSAGGVYVAGMIHSYANYLKSTCNGAYVLIGPQNSSHVHYETNASVSHWFNKRIDVNGAIWRYGTNYGIDSDGRFYTKSVYANRDGSLTDGGVSLYSNSDPMTYGIAFRGTGTYGTHGYVTSASDWATYLTMNDNTTRGWIFRRGDTNVASIAGSGNMAIGLHLEFSNGAHISTNRSTDYHYGYTFNLGDNAKSIGIYSGPAGEAGGVVISPDGCLIYNSSDCGYNLQVRDKDLGSNLTNIATLTFGIELSGYYAWSRGGFKKNGSSDSYVLLGGGGHKALSDFSISGHTHSSITIPVCSSLDENSDVFKIEYAGGSNSVATKPSGVDAFGVIRLRTAAGWYGQIMMSANTAPGIYYRNANDLSSSVGWKKLLDSSNFNSYSPKLDGTGASGTWNISITGNANTVDNIHATGFLRWKGMLNIGSNAPFQAVVDIIKDTSKLNDGGLAFYSYAGDEYTVLIGSRNDATRHGNALKWGYANKYLWMIRMINGSPRSSDWEKISAGYADSSGNADTVDGLHVHSGRNNEANKIVRTDANGYILAGWINTTSGDMGTTTATRIYCSNDAYIRYKTLANFSSDIAGQLYWANVKVSTSSNAATSPTFGSLWINNSHFFKLSGTTFTCQGGTTFTLPSSSLNTNTALLWTTASDGTRDTGIFYNSSDFAFIANSNDHGAVFAVYDTDVTQDFEAGAREISVPGSGGALWARGGFSKSGSSNDYVLLGGGGHKAISDFASSSHSHNYAANENYGGFTKSGRLPISGFYQSAESESGGNAPWSSWMHLINCLHSNTNNNYALQIAASFYDNNTFKIRVTDNSVNNAWRDIIHSGNIGSQTVANAYHLRINSANTWSTWYWSGLSGQPSWLWGSNDGTNMYVWDPNNFNVHTALYLRSLGNLNCQTGRTLNYGDIYSYNTIYSNTGAPTDYTSVIGFGRGIGGTVEIAGGWCNTGLYWRSLRDCCEDWYSWRTVLDSSNYTGFINNYYWANVKISTSSSTTTSPTVSNLTATSSIKMGNILLQNTDEINNSANGNLYLNYRNSGNVSLCQGGGNVGIGTTSPSYKLDVNGLMRASGFHHGSVNSDNYILLAGGGYKPFGGNYDNPIFLGYLNLDHGNDGTISSSFYCLGYSVSFTYTRGGNYCKISIPDTSYQVFYIKAATASVNYSGGGMDTWTGYRRGDGAWWLHCYAYSSNEVRVKGFRLANDTNDSWWGGNPLWSSNGGANRITVCIFGYVTFK